MEEKKTILLELLKMRYECAHKMRDRSQAFALWILGGGIALFGLLLKGPELSVYQKLVLTIFVMVLSIIAEKFLKAIEVGFEANKVIYIKIERALGLYKNGEYIDGDFLYPSEYSGAGKKDTSHFQSLYIWLGVISLFLVMFIWCKEIRLALKYIICC